MVLYSSSGWEQQQLRRQMKCTINNSNTFFTVQSLEKSGAFFSGIQIDHPTLH